MFSKSNILFFFSIIGLLFLLILILFGDNGLADLSSLKKERNKIIENNESIYRDNFALQRVIERLRNDSAFIEHIARQELGLVKKEDAIFKVKQSENEKK